MIYHANYKVNLGNENFFLKLKVRPCRMRSAAGKTTLERQCVRRGANQGVPEVDRVRDRRSEGILAQYFLQKNELPAKS
jgi:hypothetical protein